MHINDFKLMAVICSTCGLPDDLCACGDLDKDSSLKLKNIFDPSHSDNNVANLGEGFY